MEGLTEIMIMKLWQKQPNLCWEWGQLYKSERTGIGLIQLQESP